MYFWAFKKFAVSDPPSQIKRSPPWDLFQPLLMVLHSKSHEICDVNMKLRIHTDHTQFDKLKRMGTGPHLKFSLKAIVRIPGGIFGTWTNGEVSPIFLGRNIPKVIFLGPKITEIIAMMFIGYKT